MPMDFNDIYERFQVRDGFAAVTLVFDGSDSSNPTTEGYSVREGPSTTAQRVTLGQLKVPPAIMREVEESLTAQQRRFRSREPLQVQTGRELFDRKGKKWFQRFQSFFGGGR
ncbi:hypothetical protein OAL67_00835 [bacterium]|nr:hypothetical protein [bacterium]